MLNLISLALAFSVILFIIWNNWPDLVERIGVFLIAHAKAIRSRKRLIEDIRLKMELQN